MGYIMASALSSGLISGIWTGIANYLSIFLPELFSSWIGFVGITSYFVAGGTKNGFIRSLSSNIVGVLIGCTIIAISSLSESIVFGAAVTGAFTWLICYLARIDLTKFATCTFMGGYSAFATGGNWKLLIICLVCGNIVGRLCTLFGDFLYSKFKKKDGSENEEAVLLKFLD